MTKFSWYFLFWLFILYIRSSFQLREDISIDDYCAGKESASLGLGFSNDYQAATIRIAKRPKQNFNCCINVTMDENVALEISYVNLPSNPATSQCVDYLTIATRQELRNLCQQTELGMAPEDFSAYSLPVYGQVDVCFSANLKVPVVGVEEIEDANDYDMINTVDYGFIVRLVVYATTDKKNCENKFHGFLCKDTYRCLPQSLVCDTEEDCPKGQDEQLKECPIEDITNTEPNVPPTQLKVIPLQAFFLLTLLTMIMISLGCVWYCSSKAKSFRKNRCRTLDVSNFNAEPSTSVSSSLSTATVLIDDVAVSREVNTDEIGASSSRSDLSESNVASVPRTNTVFWSREEDPPPSYVSLFGDTTKPILQENKPVEV